MDVQRIVTNRRFGAFSISRAALARLRELGSDFAADPAHDNPARPGEYCVEIDRTDPLLIKVIEELGAAANGPEAKLEVTEIPAGVHWEILAHDGKEWVSEKLRIW